MNRPPPGSMVWWRFRGAAPSGYRFGYCTYLNSPTMVRMGAWNGDTSGGAVVDTSEIEWKPYS